MKIKNEELEQIGQVKNLHSFWCDTDKTLYLERQETKGVFIPIYKNELKHLQRVLVRVDQRFRTWKKRL